jgi:hypothetical protein
MMVVAVAGGGVARDNGVRYTSDGGVGVTIAVFILHIARSQQICTQSNTAKLMNDTTQRLLLWKKYGV